MRFHHRKENDLPFSPVGLFGPDGKAKKRGTLRGRPRKKSKEVSCPKCTPLFIDFGGDFGEDKNDDQEES